MIPDDLQQLGFRLVERGGRVLLISQKASVAVGENLPAAIREARKLQGYLAWLKRKQEETADGTTV